MANTLPDTHGYSQEKGKEQSVRSVTLGELIKHLGVTWFRL